MTFHPLLLSMNGPVKTLLPTLTNASVVRHVVISYPETAARYALKATSVTDIDRCERKSEDVPKDTQEATSSLTTQPPTEVVVTEMPYGSITPPPATDEPAEKRRPKAETMPATVRNEFFACSVEAEIGPEAKKAKHDQRHKRANTNC